MPTEAAKAPKPKPLLVFAHENAAEHRVWAYLLGAAGELTPVAKSPFTVPGEAFSGGGPCGTEGYSALRKTLFVSGLTGITALKVAKTGALKVVKKSPFGGVAVLGLAVVDAGRSTFVYAADPEGDRVFGFSAAASGALAPIPGSPFAAGDHPVTLAATSGLLFAANTQDRTISSYRIGTTGALTAGTPLALTGSTLPFGLAADPVGPFVYAADCLGTSQIFGALGNASTGALTALPSSPVASDTAEVCAGLTRVGNSLMYAFQFDGSGFNDIRAYRRGAGGALSPLGPLQSSGTGVDLAAADPSGKFVVAARSQGNQALRSFGVTEATGALTPLATQSPAWSTVDGLVVVQP